MLLIDLVMSCGSNISCKVFANCWELLLLSLNRLPNNRLSRRATRLDHSHCQEWGKPQNFCLGRWPPGAVWNHYANQLRFATRRQPSKDSMSMDGVDYDRLLTRLNQWTRCLCSFPDSRYEDKRAKAPKRAECIRQYGCKSPDRETHSTKYFGTWLTK